jgi:MFS family permease
VSAPERPPPHPFLFFVLFLPFGATSGFIVVTFGYLAHQGGIGDAAISAMIATNTLPHTWKFSWAPLIDTVWSGKGWYVSSNLISSLSILALGLVPIVPRNADLLTVIILVNGFATTFVGMTTESLMAHLTPPEGRGRAAGWSQAANVGGVFVGGLALLVAKNLGVPWLAALLVAVALMSCSVVLMLMAAPPQPTARPTIRATLRELGRDIKGILWSRSGLIGLGLCVLPIGSGGAQNLFSAMATEWHASATLVSFSNGLGSGIAALIGSLLGGRLSDSMDRRRAYAYSGVLLAVTAFGMAVMPRTPAFYVSFVSLYNLALGLCYATFSGFVLDVIGKGAAATKYNIFASIANVPIWLMGVLDGWVSQHYGRADMLWFDGGAGMIGATLLLALVVVVRVQPAAAAEPAPATPAIE